MQPANFRSYRIATNLLVITFLVSLHLHLGQDLIVSIKINRTCLLILIGVTFIMSALAIEIIFFSVRPEQFSTIRNKAAWIGSMGTTVTEHAPTTNRRSNVRNASKHRRCRVNHFPPFLFPFLSLVRIFVWATFNGHRCSILRNRFHPNGANGKDQDR